MKNRRVVINNILKTQIQYLFPQLVILISVIIKIMHDDHHTKKTFGNAVREARIRGNMSQESLAELKHKEVNGGVNGGVNGLLSYVQSHPGQRASEMAAALNLSLRTIERRLKQLKDSNKIEFRGVPKTGGITK